MASASSHDARSRNTQRTSTELDDKNRCTGDVFFRGECFECVRRNRSFTGRSQFFSSFIAPSNPIDAVRSNSTDKRILSQSRQAQHHRTSLPSAESYLWQCRRSLQAHRQLECPCTPQRKSPGLSPRWVSPQSVHLQSEPCQCRPSCGFSEAVLPQLRDDWEIARPSMCEDLSLRSAPRDCQQIRAQPMRSSQAPSCSVTSWTTLCR